LVADDVGITDIYVGGFRQQTLKQTGSVYPPGSPVSFQVEHWPQAEHGWLFAVLFSRVPGDYFLSNGLNLGLLAGITGSRLFGAPVARPQAESLITFQSGKVAWAEDVNQNFQLHDRRLTELEQAFTPESLDLLADVLPHMKMVQLDDGQGQMLTALRFEGINIQIVNGLDATNGLGNLIIGYAERDQGTPSVRNGSHNLIVGIHHGYTSFGGSISGQHNSTTSPFGSAIGGQGNQTAGLHATAVGGLNNHASGRRAVVIGGAENEASGEANCISGGQLNLAEGFGTMIAGGSENLASGLLVTLSGGSLNQALGIAGGCGTSITDSCGFN